MPAKCGSTFSASHAPGAAEYCKQAYDIKMAPRTPRGTMSMEQFQMVSENETRARRIAAGEAYNKPERECILKAKHEARVNARYEKRAAAARDADRVHERAKVVAVRRAALQRVYAADMAA